MKPVSLSSRKPGKFRELETRLREAIANGAWLPGDRLPSFSALRDEYGMAPSTVSRALQQLEHDGLLDRRQGSGIFVASPERMPRHGVIGFMGFHFGHQYMPYWMDLMRGIEGTLHQSGFEVLLLNPQAEARWEKLDGVLLYGERPSPSASAVPALVPKVAIMHPDSLWPGVRADDNGGAHAAVRHLLGLGHRRIGYLCFTGSPIIHPRLAGYRTALWEAGITPDPNWVRDITLQPGDHVPWLGQHSMAEWLEDGWGETGCTALLVQNDIIAGGVVLAIQEAGLRVPHDLSVVGYDGTFLAEKPNPHLTSVEVPLKEIGVKAAEMLLRQIHGENLEGITLTLPTTLVVRDSTAPPADPSKIASPRLRAGVNSGP